MKVLIAGTNQFENEIIKANLYSRLKEQGHEVNEACNLYRAHNNPVEGNKNVVDYLKTCDIYYIVAPNGYTGDATKTRLAIAWDNNITTLASENLDSEDLEVYLTDVCSMDELTKWQAQSKEFSELMQKWNS